MKQSGHIAIILLVAVAALASSVWAQPSASVGTNAVNRTRLIQAQHEAFSTRMVLEPEMSGLTRSL